MTLVGFTRLLASTLRAMPGLQQITLTHDAQALVVRLQSGHSFSVMAFGPGEVRTPPPLPVPPALDPAQEDPDGPQAPPARRRRPA